MRHSPQRRSVITAALTLPIIGAAPQLLAASHMTTSHAHGELAALEQSARGRIGLNAFDTASGRGLHHRADERFPFCSTFKTIAVAAILKRSERDATLLDRRVMFGNQDTTSSGYAPITEKNIASGMTIAELCAATMQYSDNAAVNLLMRELDGPEAVTAFARTIGDDVFRLDRWEPDLNSALPGDIRDTTTPAAMARTLQKLTVGDALASVQRDLLVAWLRGNKTGDARIRAGVPKTWIVGDKTGTGAYGTTNDIAVLWPRNRAAIVTAIYFTQNDKAARPRDDVLAAATRIVVQVLG